MKRSNIIAVLAVITLAGAADVTKTISFSPADPKLGSRDGYTTVEFRGLPHIELLGAPDLPVAPFQVVVPASSRVTDFEIVDFSEEPIAGSYLVLPVQYPTAYTDNYPPRPFVLPRPEYYQADAPFPARPAEFTGEGTKCGYRLASFRVYPVRYNPVARSLAVLTRLTVRISYATGAGHAAPRTQLQIALHGDELRRLVLNPEDVARFAPPRRINTLGSALLPAGNYEHVIMTTGQYRDSLIKLRDWRTRQGWRSTIVLIESIAATYPGVDTAERMRNFLKDADTTWGTIFAFIARRDHPARQYRNAYVNVSGQGVDYLPCDMYFSCLDGTWNADGDGIWGEPADSVDCWSDMNVGMITLDGFSELSKYLAKLFRYEFTPDAGWFQKSLLCNDVNFSNEFNDSVANATPSPPWSDLKMYYTGGMIPPSVQRYCDSLNSGYPLNVIIAHGSVDEFGMGTSVTSSHMIGLTNANRLSMVTAVCCHTGAWDTPGNTNGDCIAENMAFHAPNGFIGVIMNSRYGWVRVAEFFNYSICYGLLGFRTPRRITQGEALSYGRDYWHALVAVTTDTSKFRWEAYEKILFGEPAVPIWTGRAFAATVTKPAAINVGGNVPVTITVTDDNEVPVESALVCLIKDDGAFARGFADETGTITLLVSPLTPGMLQLTVTGANNLPYLDSIVVMASGKYVSYLRHAVVDTAPGGNGDGIINPGETFRLPVWLKNYGTQVAPGVTARLITHTAGVTINDSVKSFGDIAGSDSALNEEGFELSVATGLSNGYPIPCSLVCRDATDSTWVSFVTLRVGAPVLSFVDKRVLDSAASTPNGRLDPGETADLVVTLRNSGISTAYDIRAILRSGDNRLVAVDSTATFPNIASGSIGTNDTDHFVVYASATIPMETPIPCTLDLYLGADRVGQAVFTVVIGEIRTIDPVPDGPRQPALYWSYDNVDTLYAEHPDFAWVEIAGIGTRLTLSDDQTVQVNLPPGFGPFRFYGQNYTVLSICSNGWVGLGATTVSTYTNTSLPNTSLPPAFFVHWDDMYPPYGGGVWWYHDAANHRFIVEYDSVPFYRAQSNYQKFQIILYDTTLAAQDGNCKAVMQYQIITDPSSCTVGEQDPTRTVFIQNLFDGSYHRGSAPIMNGRAIKFTTDMVLTAAEQPNSSTYHRARRLDINPSPFVHTTTISWQLPADGRVALLVLDAVGRVVRTLESGQRQAGNFVTTWDGTDDNGRRLGRGVYFVRLTADGSTTNVKTVLTN